MVAAAQQVAKCNGQMISGPVSISLNCQSLLLPRAVLLTARLFHHPLGAGIPDEIFSGATYPFQMFHGCLLSRLLSALPLLVVQAYQRCTYMLKMCSCTLTKCQFVLRSVAGIIFKSCNIPLSDSCYCCFLTWLEDNLSANGVWRQKKGNHPSKIIYYRSFYYCYKLQKNYKFSCTHTTVTYCASINVSVAADQKHSVYTA